jgi:hypothetical protein
MHGPSSKIRTNDGLGHNKDRLSRCSRTIRTEVYEAQILNIDCLEDVVIYGIGSTEVLRKRTHGDRTREIRHAQMNNPAVDTVSTFKWKFCTQISCTGWEASL